MTPILRPLWCYAQLPVPEMICFWLCFDVPGLVCGMAYPVEKSVWCVLTDLSVQVCCRSYCCGRMRRMSGGRSFKDSVEAQRTTGNVTVKNRALTIPGMDVPYQKTSFCCSFLPCCDRLSATRNHDHAVELTTQ